MQTGSVGWRRRFTRKRREVGVVETSDEGPVLFDFHGTEDEWFRFQLALMDFEQGQD